MISDFLNFINFEYSFGNHCKLDSSWKCDGKFLTEDHLYCIRSGYAEFTMDEITYKLEPGKSFLFPTNRYITYHCPENFSLDWFHFRVKIFGSIDLLDHFDCPYELPIPSEGLTKELYAKLLSLEEQESTERNLASPAIIQQLCAPFLSKGKFNKDGELFLKLEPALKYIETNIDIPIRVTELASACNYEESYFADLFSKTIGLPPAKYISKRKIEKAKKLLMLGSKVDKISDSLGFYDISHFSRSFKKLTGMSPSKYKAFLISEERKVPG